MGTRATAGRARGCAGFTLFLMAVVTLPAGAWAEAVVLSEVPSYERFYGCSPTAAGMLIGCYDRNGYAGAMYGSLVPGGLAEKNTFAAEYDEDWSALVHSAIASEEHVDDFWGKPDPLGSGRTSSAEWNCLADYMGTNQGDLANGYTDWHDETATPHDWDDCAWGYGLHGIVKYIQYCGYDVASAYRQAVDARVSSGGFRFEDFKSEIDAGRPVLVHLTGHTMCGIGYDEADETIYVYDTWDTVTGVLSWGGSYSGRTHQAITALTITGGSELPGMSAPPDWWGSTDGRTVALAYSLHYPEWGDCAAPARELPTPNSPEMPCYGGSAAHKTGDLMHDELHGGSWGVAGAGRFGQIVFDVDNCENPEEMKFVFVQFHVRTDGEGYYGLRLETDGGELITGGELTPAGSDGAWQIYTAEWQIVPQPGAERLIFELLSGSDGAVWVQNVSLGTHCTPEPATLALCAAGGLALLRRRRGRGGFRPGP